MQWGLLSRDFSHNGSSFYVYVDLGPIPDLYESIASNSMFGFSCPAVMGLEPGAPTVWYTETF